MFNNYKQFKEHRFFFLKECTRLSIGLKFPPKFKGACSSANYLKQDSW